MKKGTTRRWHLAVTRSMPSSCDRKYAVTKWRPARQEPCTTSVLEAERSLWREWISVSVWQYCILPLIFDFLRRSGVDNAGFAVAVRRSRTQLRQSSRGLRSCVDGSSQRPTCDTRCVMSAAVIRSCIQQRYRSPGVVFLWERRSLKHLSYCSGNSDIRVFP